MEVISKLNFRYLLKHPGAFLAFGFGSGLSPVMPGTLGTLAAIPLYVVMAQLPLALYVALVGVAAFVGVYLCGRTSTQLGLHDHPGIVWDEFVGFWITMALAPQSWHWLITGFVIFRIIDIVKPWPISLADKHVHGGFGIMLDDVLAGFASLACLQAAIFFWSATPWA